MRSTVDNTISTPSAPLPLDSVAVIASEFQPAAAVDQLAGTLTIQSRFDGATSPFSSIPVNGRATLGISLTNATFTTASGATFTGNDGGDCSFEPAAVTGGGVGGTSVGFISTSADSISLCTNAVGESGPGAADGGVIGIFSIPIVRTANGSPIGVTFTYTQVNNDGSAVANPVTVTETLDFAELASAWDASGVAGDHQFTAGVDLVATSAGILSAGTLGTVQVDFRNATAAPLDIRSDAGTQVVVGDLFGAAGEIAITFPGGVGDIDGVSIAGIATPACAGPVADVFTCDIVAADITALGTARAITYTVGGVTPPVTPEQIPTAVFTTDPATDYVAAGFNGNLAEITHDDGLGEDEVRSGGGASDTYEWVRIGSGGTESNFRVQMASDADAAAVTQVRATVAAGNGVGAQTIIIPVGTDANSEAVIRGATVTFNSRSLGANATGSGNADITTLELQYDDTVIGTAEVNAATSARQLVSRSPGSFVATGGLTDN